VRQFETQWSWQNPDVAVHIGTSGWSYAHWEGVLYPAGLASHRRLDYYLPQFRSAELNASFYRWPGDAAFEHWRRRLPTDFVLSVKAPRALTHAKRLFGPERWLTRIAGSLARLGGRRGVLLVQLPPTAVVDVERLAYFLACVPPELKVAVEFRHSTWHHDHVFALLEHHRAAYCVMSGAHLPCILRATAPFVYVRLHGPDPDHLYGGSYTADDLRWWADRIQEWQGMGREVFAYFNNDGEGNAVRNAVALRQLVGA
jgi:uncharacterized protein YecE (DUF72 family)